MLRYREKHVKYILISCGCVLLFTNIHGRDGVSTRENVDGCIYLPSVILLCPEYLHNGLLFVYT